MKSMEGQGLYFFCSILLSLFTFCTSVDTITIDHPITDGTTIVSAGRNFKLGFFSPGKSKNRYVGIWYSKIPTKDVVWVANRETPLNNTSGKLMLKVNGILVLLDGCNKEIWSSNSSISLKNPVAQLSDTGNLVVREGNDHNSKNSAWQSFDYPGEYSEMLDVDGFPQLFLYRGVNKSIRFRHGPWNGQIFTGQTDNCARYSFYGAFGKCNINNSPPCDCLKGFIPKYPQDWEATDWSNGCTAYSNIDVRDGGSGCLLWFGDLTDISYLDEDDQDLYIRIAASDFDISQNGQKKQEVTKIVIPTISGILILSFLVWFALYKRKKVSATNNFSSDNLIGEGGFGFVYKGKLPTGTEIAVKKISENSGQGAQEWENEVIIIAKLQHRNLVTLQGCCAEGGQRILIYEYMPNNSLDYFIFDESRKRILTWQKRFEIAVGISHGILYLHQDSRFKIIHRDLKASNILLDAELNAKISDFGLARIVGEDDALARTKRIIGTYGYMSPEYAVDGNFSVKSDVFSLGVILLELISGRKNRTFHHSDHHHNLLGHAWLLWNDGDPIELMDNCVRDSYVESQVLRCIHVALLCVSKLPEDRPTMASVVFMLENEEVALPQPKEPGFFVERNSTEASSKNVDICHSEVAKMTFSILEPR
ncbi:PREDICTED: G-type lectin S-receptor-like serine/threonine-protein kinase At4g27290 [Ipomoea nil]|uniref:G-type lectin S-receptor-like serine/threonine-protein kinase At4g27290 n=1 Tax=Ipomoea nil TaxID=35883 RepID=UPI00090114D3|nr:PREDICTED: G-type lectin S-receptor-like serine/threonine-protein kinase At4g27290 [Ipomoea nil]